QYICNLKVSETTKSTPFSLMFARAPNFFKNYNNQKELTSLSPKELESRLNYMTSVVYPEINELSKTKATLEGGKFLKYNRIIHFQPGAYVMVKDELRTKKSEPLYTGPFKIIRRNKGGAYELLGPDGTIYTR
ncbi:hypothetical protein ROZALSC1DRAFT_7303, partial [Rozella allomycis CSF55]